MSSQATTDESTAPRPVIGTRACPLPIGLASSLVPAAARKSHRNFPSTGVITADVLEREIR